MPTGSSASPGGRTAAIHARGSASKKIELDSARADARVKSPAATRPPPAASAGSLREYQWANARTATTTAQTSKAGLICSGQVNTRGNRYATTTRPFQRSWTLDPPTTASAIQPAATTSPPTASQGPDAEGNRFASAKGRAKTRVQTTAVLEMARPTGNSATHACLKRLPVRKTGSQLMTMPIRAISTNLRRRAGLYAQANATAIAAKAPTLIFTRHSAPTIAPISAAVARGRWVRNVAAATMHTRSRLISPDGLIGSVVRAPSTWNMTSSALTPIHRLRVRR